MKRRHKNYWCDRSYAAEAEAASARETAVGVVESLYLNSGGKILDAHTLDAVIGALKHYDSPEPVTPLPLIARDENDHRPSKEGETR